MEKRSRRHIRDLVALAAFQGLSENEIGCARISMMARSTCCSIQGPDTEAQDQSSPDHQIQLATHSRSIQSALADAYLPWRASVSFRIRSAPCPHVSFVAISAASHPFSCSGCRILEICPRVAPIVPCDDWRRQWCRRRLVDSKNRDLTLRHKLGQAFQPGHGMASRSATAQSTVAMRRWGPPAIVTLAAVAAVTALTGAATARQARPAHPPRRRRRARRASRSWRSCRSRASRSLSTMPTADLLADPVPRSATSSRA